MIIGVTGTTSGIGKEILKLPYDFKTFDRMDGDVNDANLVFQKLGTCDVFINNAWDGENQLILLDYFFKQWEKKDKKIITVGSSVSTYKPSGTGYEDYVMSKKRLRNLHIDIVNLKTTSCKSYLINPGVTDTKLTSARTDKKMTVKNVTDVIQMVLTSDVYIPEIYFYAK